MASLLDRLLAWAVAQDEAVNAIGGGSPRETLSGTAGRAAARGYWWGKPLVALIDHILGKGHCARQAAIEAARRQP